ncbi:sensor histidine kinase, partial [Okeania sp. SIO2G5]|uniref:sensor histidine kinase n=1 Tax=Okeania sp. SIO2G5 TaxID=2607796 RepID=UPI0013C17F32
LEFMLDDLPRLLTSMDVGAQRIAEIVQSLRTFSRLDESAYKRVNIHQGLESTLMILKSRLREQPDRPAIQLHKAYGDLPLVNCYPGPLNQVFMNVLVNAIDALEDYGTQQHGAAMECSPSVSQAHSLTHSLDKEQKDGCESDGESLRSGRSMKHMAWNPELWLSTQPIEPDKVQISIQDNGPGIPEAVLSKIFDPFFTTKSIGHGTGLGLSISYQIIVDQHKGEFICKSQPGEGTTFLIIIPA